MKRDKKSSLKNGKKTICLFAFQSMLEQKPTFMKNILNYVNEYDLNFVFYDIEMFDKNPDYSNYLDLSFFDVVIMSKEAREFQDGEFALYIHNGMKHRVVRDLSDIVHEDEGRNILEELQSKLKVLYREVLKDDFAPTINYGELIANISDMSLGDYAYYLCKSFSFENYMLNIFTSNVGEGRSVLAINESHLVKSKNNKFMYRYFTPSLKAVKSNYSVLVSPLYYGNDKLGYMVVDLKVGSLKHYGLLQSLSGNLLYSDAVVKKAQLKDPLTKLSNRIYFNRRVDDLIQDKRNKIAIMYVDINKFKNINNNLGHAYGDKVLEFVATTLMDSAQKPEDVYRLNGDEFVVLLSKYKSNKEIIKFAKEQITKLGKEFVFDSKSVSLDLNVGISTFPEDGLSSSELLKTADKALEISKRYGLNHFSFYDPLISEESRNAEQVKKVIADSIENDNFLIQFQPRVSCDDGKITHFEALVRIHTDGGVLFPDEFIGIAEDFDMISKIDEHVLDLSCKELSSWNQKDEIAAHISINVSLKELKNIEIVDKYIEVIKKYNLRPEMFSLEINNKVVASEEHLSLGTLNRFKEEGFNIVLDVDGFTFAALENIKLYPIDSIKIQRNVINSIVSSKINQIIVQSLIGIAKELKYKVIAEGIENSLQYKFLKEVGCDEVQGFYFSEPKYANDLNDFKKASYRFTN